MFEGAKGICFECRPVYYKAAKGICFGEYGRERFGISSHIIRRRKVYVSGSMAGSGSASPRGRHGGGFAVTKLQNNFHFSKFRMAETGENPPRNRP